MLHRETWATVQEAGEGSKKKGQEHKAGTEQEHTKS